MPAPHSPPDHHPPPRVVGDLRLCEYIAAECAACGHCGDVALRDLVTRHGPWFPLGELARRLRCGRCGGAAIMPPRIVSATPRRLNHMSYRDWFRAQSGRADTAGLPAPGAARPAPAGGEAGAAVSRSAAE